MIAAVALVSCGGGGSSSQATLPSVSSPTLTVAPPSGTWSASLGPWNAQNSGKLNAFAVDPQNSSTIYVGGGIGAVDGVTSDTGVYKTTNGGSSWSARNAGLTDTTINALLFDAHGVLYAATETGGIARSTDGAASWQQVSSAAGVRQLVQSGPALYAATQGGVLTSNDGMTWSMLVPTSTQANAVAISGSSIYVGLADGTLLRATPSGSAATITRFAAQDAPPVVHAIAVDPASPNSIYVSFAAMVNGIYSDALMHTADGGATWRNMSLPASLRGAQAIAFSTTVAHRLYIAGVGLGYTDDAQNFALADGYGDARTLFVMRGDRLAIGSDQGIGMGSYGTGFTSITAGLPVNIVRSVAVHGNTILATMQDFAPARSTDGGATWQTLSLGSNENGVAYINPFSSNLCYMLDNGISMSSDGCTSFSQQAIGQRIASTEPFATDPSSVRTYVVTGNGLYVASDGEHFYAIACSVPHPVDVAVDPRNGNHIFISSSSDGGPAVWRSTDGGNTFRRSATLAPPGPSYPNDAPVLTVDPSTGAVLAVTETAMYRSTDGGATFTALRQLSSQTRSFAAQALERRDPDAREASGDTAGYNIGEHAQFVAAPSGPMLIVTTSAGIFSSFDDGTTIHALAQNAVSHDFEGFAVDGGRLCVGTDGEGVICADASALASLSR